MRTHLCGEVSELLADQSVNQKDVDFVVMDIQGYEAKAIAGGLSLFCLAPPLMMEMDHVHVDSPQRLDEICCSVEKHYQWFHDLDDMTCTRRSISSLRTHFAKFTGYRDILLF